MDSSLETGHHWEIINPIKSRVEIAFDLGVDPAKTNAEQLRRDLFATLNNDVLPQIAKAAPGNPDNYLPGSIDSDFDVFEVNAEVPKDGFKGEWRKEATGNTVLNGNVRVDLTANNFTPPADMLQTMRANVADDIAELIANSYSSFVSSKDARPAAKTRAKVTERSTRDRISA